MPSVTVDSKTQRYRSRVVQEPDILLLHTTEVWGWPGYNGGGTAPHDTIKPVPGVGIIVRRHYPYDEFSKSLENDAGGVETNKRGVIQVELMGTCDPSRARRDKDIYFWPEADDAVLEALADYYRPVMAEYGIPARAMAEFVAYPKSYGDRASQRLSQSEWANGSGICGHQHAPENSHGDPGAFPIDRFIQFLQEDDDMPLSDTDVKKVLTTPVIPSPMLENEKTVSLSRGMDLLMRWALEARDNAVAGRKVAEAQALKGAALTPDEIKAALKEALSESVELSVAVKTQETA